MRTVVKMNFDPEVAVVVGERAAIILENIHYWIEKNRVNDRHFYEGTWWTYNSKRAFEALFYWCTANQIRTALDKLRDEGYLKIGKFNKHSYDQTLWYSLGENGWCEKTQLDWGKNPNGLGTEPQPIPNDKPDYKRGGDEAPATPISSEEVDYKILSTFHQVRLLRNSLKIEETEYSDFDIETLIIRIKKSQYKNRIVETAFNWITKDLRDEKFYALGIYYPFGEGMVMDLIPKTFKDMEKRMNEVLLAVKTKRPDRYQELTQASPAPKYDF